MIPVIIAIQQILPQLQLPNLFILTVILQECGIQSRKITNITLRLVSIHNITINNCNAFEYDLFIRKHCYQGAINTYRSQLTRLIVGISSAVLMK